MWPLLTYSPSFVQINSIRRELETVLDFWLVYVCTKECELIKGGHTFWLFAVITIKQKKNSERAADFLTNFFAKLTPHN